MGRTKDGTSKKMLMRKRTSLGEKAITLIALVVTIVILLILAGVTITMTLGQNGLFTRAREGAAAYNESEVRDDLSMLITQYTWDKASEKTDKSLGDYLKDNGATSVKANADGKTLEVTYKGYTFKVNKDSGEITEVSKGEGSDSPTTPTIIPKVGEIVDYKPDTPSTGYDLSTAKSGYSSAQIINGTYDPTTWKIMEVDKSGNVTKLLGIGSKTVTFQGSKGYNNGVYLLNDICKSRYGNASLGATARSLNIEDIESRMNATGIAARNAYKAGTTQYGTTKKYTGIQTIYPYPALYEQEKYAGVHRDAQGNLVEVSDVANGTQVITGSVDTTAQSKMNPNGKSGSDNIYTTLPETSETTGPSKTNLTCTQTFYYFDSIPSSYFDDTNFHSMIFGTGTEFWLASRYVDCRSDRLFADFGLRHVDRSDLYGHSLFYSNGYNNNDYYRLAPVVSLGSGVQIKSGEGTTEKPYIIGK